MCLPPPFRTFSIPSLHSLFALFIKGGSNSMHAKLIQSCPILCHAMEHSPPGSSVHGILQARIMEWVATTSSRGSNRLMLIFQHAPLQTPTQFLNNKITAGRDHQKHLIFIPSPFSTSPRGCQWCPGSHQLHSSSSKQVPKAELSVSQHLASQCDKWIFICLILKIQAPLHSRRGCILAPCI